MSYIVYKHTTPSGKVYVGITGRNPTKRWSRGAGYLNNEYFTRAINRYGWDNILHEILFTGLSKEEAEEKEIELIAFYHSDDRKHGYNIQHGGHSIGKHAEETKKKIGDANRGKKQNSDVVRKRAESCRKPVLCIETGKVFPSVKSAGEHIGIAPPAVSACLKGKTMTAGGYHWEYVEKQVI